MRRRLWAVSHPSLLRLNRLAHRSKTPQDAPGCSMTGPSLAAGPGQRQSSRSGAAGPAGLATSGGVSLAAGGKYEPPGALGGAAWASVAAYLELHVEQGPVLDRAAAHRSLTYLIR